MKNEAAVKTNPTPNFDKLEEMFRQKDADETKRKQKQRIFSLPFMKKGKHELQNR